MNDEQRVGSCRFFLLFFTSDATANRHVVVCSVVWYKVRIGIVVGQPQEQPYIRIIT